jgi:hypothetical protein
MMTKLMLGVVLECGSLMWYLHALHVNDVFIVYAQCWDINMVAGCGS